MKFILILVFVCHAILGNAQRRDTLTIGPSEAGVFGKDSTLKYLEIENEIYCESFGRLPIPVKNFQRFLKIYQSFSTDSLIQLAQGNYQLSLKVYAAWALLLRDYESVEIISRSLLQNYTVIGYSCGCIKGQEFPVNQFMYLLFAGEIDHSVNKLPSKKLKQIKSEFRIPALKDKIMQPCASKMGLEKLKS
jgi:hypothetical protein